MRNVLGYEEQSGENKELGAEQHEFGRIRRCR